MSSVWVTDSVWITASANHQLANALDGGEDNDDFISFRQAFCYLAHMRNLTNGADVSRDAAQQLIDDLDEVYDSISLDVKDVQDILYGVQSS